MNGNISHITTPETRKLLNREMLSRSQHSEGVQVLNLDYSRERDGIGGLSDGVVAVNQLPLNCLVTGLYLQHSLFLHAEICLGTEENPQEYLHTVEHLGEGTEFRSFRYHVDTEEKRAVIGVIKKISLVKPVGYFLGQLTYIMD